MQAGPAALLITSASSRASTCADGSRRRPTTGDNNQRTSPSLVLEGGNDCATGGLADIIPGGSSDRQGTWPACATGMTHERTDPGTQNDGADRPAALIDAHRSTTALRGTP
ncbi:hypothetical protein GCM10010178_88480 [Lentzea flava]|uniref:Hemolysin-type calcium-binding repeat-containing protein n=1 Tax=Lentzea flava TaxID=103732 RepID=A0ABQ2VFJ7_9PSEU|nr:hypothetical protein GCM10010178_88480 [Lentzea flava]